MLLGGVELENAKQITIVLGLRVYFDIIDAVGVEREMIVNPQAELDLSFVGYQDLRRRKPTKVTI